MKKVGRKAWEKYHKYSAMKDRVAEAQRKDITKQREINLGLLATNQK